MDAALDRILHEGYLDGIDALPFAQVRALRTECQGVETQLSYLRRIVQGRHDIVAGELARRARGGDRYDMSDLVGELPEILADRIHAPGPGRLPVGMEPGELSGLLPDRLASIVERVPIESPGDASDDDLRRTTEELQALEHDVSAVRRQLFQRIDTLQAEITSRYRDGEARVDDVLSGGS